MASADDLRRFALSLEGTVETPHMDRAAFKVKRIYATLPPDRRTVNLLLTRDQQALKCEVAPDAFAAIPNAWGRQGWTTATLAALTQRELEDALALAWRNATGRPPRRG